MKCTKCKNFDWCPTRRDFLCFSFARKEGKPMKSKNKPKKKDDGFRTMLAAVMLFELMATVYILLPSI